MPALSRCRAAVLGSPIAHSLSPALHRAAYAALGLPWSYEAVEVDEPGLPAFLAAMDESWAGLSLTMPLKECVIDHLDEVDALARATTSVNTVLPMPSGWRGANTDVFGITEALLRAGLPSGPQTGLVLGAGATSRSAVAALAQLGVHRVLVSARRPQAAASLSVLAQSLGLHAEALDWSAGQLHPLGPLAEVDVTISTLPRDAGGHWSAYARGSRGALLDAAYHPWPTPLAVDWGGAVIASGRDMLLWQAVEQVRLMTQLEPPVAAMQAALPAG